MERSIMPIRFRPMPLVAVITATLVGACGSNEPAAEDHVAVRVDLSVNGLLMADDTIRLTDAGTDTVRLTFYNQSDENLDVAEGEHFSLLTFTPATGLAVTMDPAHHFRHEVIVTAAAGTTGTVDIGYGHDAAADEEAFAVAYKVE
jgi:hypothetical protein